MLAVRDASNALLVGRGPRRDDAKAAAVFVAENFARSFDRKRYGVSDMPKMDCCRCYGG